MSGSRLRLLGVSLGVFVLALGSSDRPATSSLFSASLAASDDASGAAATYIDHLVSQARQLLAGSGRDPSAAAAILKEAARAGNTGAMLLLADLYARGDGIPADFDTAKTLIEGALHAGSGASAWRGLAQLYAGPGSHRDPAKAVDAYQHAVDLGDTGAMIALARIVGSGDGVPLNFDRARSLLDAAIANGAAVDGWLAMAALYRGADAAHRDGARMVDAFQKAVDLGDGDAVITLARILGSGDGVPVDFDRARTLLESGIAHGGDLGALWASLGDLYRNAALPRRDLAKAVDAYQHSVDAGDNDMLIVLAGMIGTGEGGPVDFPRAKRLLDKAVSSGAAASGWAALARLYRETDKANRNPVKAVDAYKRAVDLGDTASMIALARMLSSGDGVPADPKRARTLLEGAVAAGGENTAQAWASLGDLLRDAAAPRRDPAKAIDAYQHAADLGDAGSMVRLARILAAGDGVAVDFDRARKALEKAISLKDDYLVAAWAATGDLYRTADQSHRDPAKAVDAYQHAADLGDTASMVRLASLVSSGDGATADFGRARTLLQKASAANDDNAAWAWASLGDLYRNADKAQRDLAKAVDAYQHAVDAGNTDVLVVLARLVSAGDGVPVDFPRARTLLEKSIAAGAGSPGWSALARLYRDGDAANRNAAKAVDAFKHAVELGDTASMVELARILGAGDGVPADFKNARVLLERAVTAGGANVAWAWSSLGDLYRTAEPSKRDPAKAAGAYQHAADLGDSGSMIRLAALLSAPDSGVPNDFNKARTLFEKAAAAGGENGIWAWSSLGDLHRTADPSRRDVAKAADAYQHAADLGDTASMIRLAALVTSGEGIPADFARARTLLEKAIAGKDGNATWAWASLGDLYRGPSGALQNPAKAVEAYDHAAAAGDAGSMIKLARIVGSGAGVPVDFDRARSLLEKVVTLGGDSLLDGWVALGELYRTADPSRRDVAKAANAYQHAADMADTASMIRLAGLLSAGKGIPVDFDRARGLLDRAAAAGGGNAAWAWASLGDLYRAADPSRRDVVKAADAYQHAADLRDSGSMIRLAGLVSSGDRIPADFNRARTLLETAIAVKDDNSAWAWATLGGLYRDADQPHRDAAKAVDAYQHAADLGDVGAMIKLARMRASGDGVPVDFRGARSLLESAVAKGGENAGDAWAALGDLYRNADEEHRATAKAVDAYQHAVDLGNTDVVIVLARMVGAGDGVPADFDRANALLNRTAQAGGENGLAALIALGNLYQDADQGHRDLGQALTFYRRAADAGSGEAHLAAAQLEGAGKIETEDQRASLARHYREAARILGIDPAVKAMYELGPTTLYVVVQEMLSRGGNPIRRIDGVFDRQMQAAIDRFCAARRITSCGKGLVSFDLLKGLLQPEA